MDEHVGRPVTMWQVAEILNVAYRKAASVQNAVSGRSVVIDHIRIPRLRLRNCYVTNVITEAVEEHTPMPPLTPVVAARALTDVAMEAVPELCPPKIETS